MTSAEFAATYRVLKTLTEHGARSQIAQEVALGRMVMVHTLDVTNAMDPQRLRADIGMLPPSAGEQVLGVFDVDGTTVVVTRFLASFTDLPSWIREHAAVDDTKTLVMEARPVKPAEPAAPVSPPAPLAASTGGFTAIFAPAAVASPDVMPPKAPAIPSFTDMFGVVKAAESESAPVPPVPAVTPQASEPGEFTRQFQKMSPPPSAGTPPAAPPVAATPAPAPPAAQGGDSFTKVFGGVKVPPAAPPSPAAMTQAPPPPLASPPPTKGGESFTQIFGGITPPPAPTAPTTSAPPAAARFGSVIPPQPLEAPRQQPAAPPPPPKKASGEFTQLFDRLTPSVSVPAQQRPPASPPSAPPMAAPAAPTPSWNQAPSPAAATPPTPAWQSPPAPPTSAPGAAAASGPSEFTRILGKVTVPSDPANLPRTSGASAPGAGFQLPPVPQMPQAPQMNMPAPQLPPMQLPKAQFPAAGLTPLSVPQQPASSGQAPTRSHLPLIIALNVVLIAAIGLVLYFVLKH